MIDIEEYINSHGFPYLSKGHIFPGTYMLLQNDVTDIYATKENAVTVVISDWELYSYEDAQKAYREAISKQGNYPLTVGIRYKQYE